MSVADRISMRGRKLVGDRLDRVGRASGFELLGRLVKVTPVDTGRARGNWNTSLNAEDPTTADDRRAPEALTTGQSVIARLHLSDGDRLFLTNGLPYIAPLNNGSSAQAPAAFIQTTVTEMRSFVEAAARAENRRG